MTFQETLDGLRARIEGNLPPASVKIMHEATAELERSGISGGVRRVGETAPDFTLPNQSDSPRALADLRAEGPVVLTFYRGFWCPYCNADLQNLQKHVAELEAAGATLVAISPERPQYSRKMIKTRKLSFDILYDAHNEVAAGYGLRFALGAPLKALYRDSLNINLALYHGDEDWTLPMPARFVIDREGAIRYAEANPDYTRRPDPDDLLEVVRAC